MSAHESAPLPFGDHQQWKHTSRVSGVCMSVWWACVHLGLCVGVCMCAHLRTHVCMCGACVAICLS